MKRHFYSNIVTLDTVIGELSLLEISPEEKKELEELAHDHLHQTILDAILSELSERDKKIFLANVEYETHERVWKHLNDKVDNIEDRIKTAAEKIKKELQQDIARVKSQ